MVAVHGSLAGVAKHPCQRTQELSSNSRRSTSVRLLRNNEDCNHLGYKSHMKMKTPNRIRSSVTLSLVEESRGGPFVLWDGIARSMDLASSMGFDGVEIFPPDAESLAGVPIGQMAADRNLSIAAIGTGAGWVKHRLSLADGSAGKRQEAIGFIARIVEVAASLGAGAIIGSMQGRSTPEVSKERASGYLREGLEALDSLAARSSGRVFYEPLNRYETDQCNTLESGCRMIEGLGGTTLLADWFHMNIEEADMARSLREAGDRVGHVHFADTNRSAVGMGHLEVSPLIQALRDINYTGYLSAEVFPLPSSIVAAEVTLESYRRYVS